MEMNFERPSWTGGSAPTAEIFNGGHATLGPGWA